MFSKEIWARRRCQDGLDHGNLEEAKQFNDIANAYQRGYSAKVARNEQFRRCKKNY